MTLWQAALSSDRFSETLRCSAEYRLSEVLRCSGEYRLSEILRCSAEYRLGDLLNCSAEYRLSLAFIPRGPPIQQRIHLWAP